MFVDTNDANNGAATGVIGKKLPARTSQDARRVFKLLQEAPQNNEGLHVHNIASQLGMQPNDVFKAGDELLGDGLIYTTVDDETWAVLEY
jgi:replication factor A2